PSTLLTCESRGPLTVNFEVKPSAACLFGRSAMKSFVALTLMGVLLLAAWSRTVPGAAPMGELPATSISFGQQMAGPTEDAQTVSLTKTGSAALQIEGIKAESGFEVTSSCGASLPANATCEIDVSFSPVASGQVSGRVLVTDNAVGTPHTIQLTGSG